MDSSRIACAASALLLTSLTGCASAPVPSVSRPDAPTEMMIPAPPSGYFTTKLETILSRSFEKPKPSQTDSAPAKAESR